MIDAGKLDTAILKYLSVRDGKQEALNTVNWSSRLAEELKVTFVGTEEVESAMKCLCAEGIVRLVKYDEELGGTYEYRLDDGPVVERRFFGYGSFDVLITDQGRRFLNVPGGRIGFKPPA